MAKKSKILCDMNRSTWWTCINSFDESLIWLLFSSSKVSRRSRRLVLVVLTCKCSRTSAELDSISTVLDAVIYQPIKWEETKSAVIVTLPWIKWEKFDLRAMTASQVDFAIFHCEIVVWSLRLINTIRILMLIISFWPLQLACADFSDYAAFGRIISSWCEKDVINHPKIAHSVGDFLRVDVGSSGFVLLKLWSRRRHKIA